MTKKELKFKIAKLECLLELQNEEKVILLKVILEKGPFINIIHAAALANIETQRMIVVSQEIKQGKGEVIKPKF